MIVTTTNNVPGKEIVEYKGLVTGEVVAGINFLKDIGAGLRNLFGGRSSGYEKELLQAKEKAVEEIKENARKIGANAVIGLVINIETVGADSSMLIVNVLGTAVQTK